MPTIEERLQALEQENAARKKTEELLTIAVRALVSKEAFEKLQDTVEKSQEQNGKLFDILNNHNIFTNERLGDIQSQLTELNGKIVGQQTEMRQRFTEHTAILDEHTAVLNEHTLILTEHTARFDRLEGLLTQVLERLPKAP